MRQKRIYFTVRTKLLAGLTQKIYDSILFRTTWKNNSFPTTTRKLLGTSLEY